MSWNVWDVILIGFVIALLVIAAWLYYAYTYRTSVERLSRKAGKKYEMIAPDIQHDQYVIQCDSNLSSYNSDTEIFTAVITLTPDLKHPSAIPLKNVIRTYKIVYSSDQCDPNNYAQYVNCINVND